MALFIAGPNLHDDEQQILQILLAVVMRVPSEWHHGETIKNFQMKEWKLFEVFQIQHKDKLFWP